MRTISPLTAALLFFCSALAQAVDVIQPYQGRIVQNGTNYDGTGYAYFEIVFGIFDSVLWRSDSSGRLPDSGSPQPNLSGTPLTVTDGAFSVGLGDVALQNMDPLPSSVFEDASLFGIGLRLRIYFSADNVNYELLSPDTTFHPAPFASVARVALTADSFSGSISGSQIADGTVTSDDMAVGQDLTLNSISFNGGVDAFGFNGSGAKSKFSLSQGLTVGGPLIIDTAASTPNAIQFFPDGGATGSITFDTVFNISGGAVLVRDRLSAEDSFDLTSVDSDPVFKMQTGSITFDKADEHFEIDKTSVFDQGVVIGNPFSPDADDGLFFGSMDSGASLKMNGGDFQFSRTIRTDGGLHVGTNLPGGASIHFGSDETAILTYATAAGGKFIANDDLDVQGSLDVTGSIGGSNITGSNLRSNANIYVNEDGADGFSSIYFYEAGSKFGEYIQWDDPGDHFNISDSVDVMGTVSEVSDRRLKRNISASPYGLEAVLALEPVTYQWNPATMDDPGDEFMVGLIAQDVVEVVPEVVGIPHTQEDFYSLDYDALVPVLIKAIQQQNARIDSLEKELSDLKAR